MNWYELINSDEVQSPSLLVFPDRVKHNAELMVAIAQSPIRLRPHIKTHKMAEIIDIQLKMDIDKFKCATLREAEILAKSGANDILLAMQPVSYQMNAYVEMILKYPELTFSTVVDNLVSAKALGTAAKESGLILELWVDINNGMNRTGISPGKEAETVYEYLCNDPFIKARGLHVYDGHIHTADLIDRTKECERDYLPVLELKNSLEKNGFKVPVIVAGGTPTFPIHTKREGVELSPGTPLLWDTGYGDNYKDLEFIPAAVLLTRIISKPGKDLLCLDLGHKSVASEMSLPRVEFLGNHKFQQVSQSEEHLVLKCPNSDSYHIGQPLYAVPIHICPTVSKYPIALIVQHNKVTGSWEVAARDHNLTKN